MEANAGEVFLGLSGDGVVELDVEAMAFAEEDAGAVRAGSGVGAGSVASDPLAFEAPFFWCRFVLGGDDGVMENFFVSGVEFGGADPDIVIEGRV